MSGDPLCPIRLSVNLDHEIETAFVQLIHQPWGRSTGLSDWQPAVDLFETDDEYLIEADLPGVLPQDIEVRVDDHRIELRGQRRSVKFNQSSRGLSLERSHGQFHRLITLPHPVDSSRMTTHCEAGILRIHLPKRSSGRHA